MFAGDHALWLADRRILIVLITLIIVTPLCMPRELNALEWVTPLLLASCLSHINFLAPGMSSVHFVQDHTEILKFCSLPLLGLLGMQLAASSFLVG